MSLTDLELVAGNDKAIWEELEAQFMVPANQDHTSRVGLIDRLYSLFAIEILSVST